MYRFTRASVLSAVMKKTLLFVTICLIKGHMGDAADAMTGITGGSVIIKCVHEPETAKESAKSFCKVSGIECTTLTEEQHDLWIPEERFSLTYNRSLGLISVLIRNLRENDSGVYRCVADGQPFHEVKLDVEQESCCGTSEEQTAHLRETAVIRCKYPEKYKSYVKELYKVQNGSLLPYFFTRESNPRFSLDDRKLENVFTVTIASVNGRDDGVYFCGAIDPENIRHSLLFTEIQLHVSDLRVIIIVCVCLILLLAGGLSLFWLKRRCKKTKGSDPRSTEDGEESLSGRLICLLCNNPRLWKHICSEAHWIKHTLCHDTFTPLTVISTHWLNNPKYDMSVIQYVCLLIEIKICAIYLPFQALLVLFFVSVINRVPVI
ncbi:uncharacterized protein LOC122360989 isoform X2 [Puntigrus tetrazona]|uniref:uncharacterized protein LOC122334468 isoform X2 n=1 Tax=Puntigrus tetrazona TaxID=1606681 RepID=UPI001C8A2FB8|nr:uncharacterized protein LOC122334468 isoform X2 [Puntigrus tetrazona]XP_043117939.1 uncharacterized protein LOC122360989 isoform X2 [Puntigrus tetrazona]